MTQGSIQFTLPDEKDLIGEVLKTSGQTASPGVNGKLSKEAGISVAKIFEKLKPASIFKTEKILRCENGVIEGERLAVKSSKLSRLLSYTQGEEKIICSFAATLGKDTDSQIRESISHSVTRAFFTDIAGSILIETFASQIEDQLLNRFAKENITITSRFSPGYCDWDIQSGQTSIFDTLNPASIGITKLSSGMMIPEKSITAIIICARQVRYRTPCVFCAKSTCDHRREPVNKQNF